MFEEVKRGLGARVTVFASKWGYEVARIYGVLEGIRRIACGGRYEEILVGDRGFYYIGRFSLGRYRLLALAPATGNTVAKIVRGIADSLPAAAFAQALKSGTPIVVLPTDIPRENGYAVSTAPCRVDPGVCVEECTPASCPAAHSCPTGALKSGAEGAWIDLSACIGCGLCIQTCRAGAIRCWETIRVKPSPIDLENIERLRRMRGVRVVETPRELLEAIKKILLQNTLGTHG